MNLWRTISYNDYIEAKQSGKETEMDQDCDAAVRQIATRKYAEGLYGCKQIFCYGIAFFQKQARVRRLSDAD